MNTLDYKNDSARNTYCDFVKDLPRDNIHRRYHDYCYGFALDDDNELFGRLILEINQAGLSWDTILKKEKNFKKAYDEFDLHTIANYDAIEKQRLLNDPGIIRNRLKIEAAIYNAEQILKLQKEYGSFLVWIEHHRHFEKKEWVKLFKKHFKFVGGEIVGEFLMSIGVLKGAHNRECPIYKKLTLK